MSRSRVTCPSCKNRSTLNQLKGADGFCSHCGYDIDKAVWRKNVGRNLIQLSFDNSDLDRIFDVARGAALHPTELVKLAVISKVFAWDANPELLKQDRMLRKLVK
jgi:endogenous inhibitor of DNA gyrase (YacG/DUF329 family)